MSERNLRGAVAAIVLIGEDFVVTPSAIAILRAALAADPDVAAVARKIVDEVCKGTLSPEQVWAVGLIKRWMEETFKFRLTDGGYEWVDGDA